MENNDSKYKISTILIGLFLLFALLGGGYFWQQNKSLQIKNKVLAEEAAFYNRMRTELLKEVDSLEADYNALVAGNTVLKTDYEEISSEVAARKVEIRKIKKEYANTASDMKAEIEQLQSIKKELTGYVNQLKSENAQLKQSNQTLTTQVANVEAKNKVLSFQISELRQMNGLLANDKKALMAAVTRATDLRIDIRKKGDKPTGSYRRAQEISVSFAISNIPDNRKGNHKIYVVIKDAQGIPVKVANPVKATIQSTTSKVEEIIAQQMEIRNLFEKVRLQMKINPEVGNLHKGYYRVSVYADWGLLGGAEFQLR